jgi:aminotransferase EvaB
MYPITQNSKKKSLRLFRMVEPIKKVPFFDFKRRIARYSAELNDAYSNVLAVGDLILGKQVEAFESEFARYLGVESCIGVGNGTDALTIALRALDLPNRSKVVTVANAGGYSTTAILSNGLIPKYVDVAEDNCLVSLQNIVDLDLRGVSAVVLTHLYGNPIPEVISIVNFLRNKGIAVIEDCAQAHGATIDSARVGSFGDLSTFSFYPTKNLGALGDGGAIVTSNQELATRVRSLRTYGWGKKYEVIMPGGQNSRLDEIQASFLRIFLESLDGDNLRRNEISERYISGINSRVVNLISANYRAGCVSHLFVIKTNRRDELINFLSTSGISTAIHFPLTDNTQLGFGHYSDLLPVSEKLAKQVLSLPNYPELSNLEIDYVIEKINFFHSGEPKSVNHGK